MQRVLFPIGAAGVLLILIAAAFARADLSIPGYQSRVAGEVFEYHSPDVEVTKGLLARCLDGRPIEWETAPVPEQLDGAEFVSFVWLFGLQVNPAEKSFDLSVNGEKWLTIRTRPGAEPRDWTIQGLHGSSLRFRATMVDRFGDLMGYAMLRVPRSELTPGKPLHLRVLGEVAGIRSWYITFQAPVTERATLVTPPAIVRAPEGDYRPVQLSIVHLGEPARVAIAPSFGPEQMRPLEFGVNRFELRHPDAPSPTDINIDIRPAAGGAAPHTLTAHLVPVRHWTVDLVQHTHTDIGYSRPQTDILAEHVRFIDTALDACDKTDNETEDAKFRWTCESSWAVSAYLRSRTPDQIARLRRRVEEGRIETTGMFLNMSELIDEPSYADFVRPIGDLRRAGLTVTTAMQDDVNGVAWCLADMLPKLGVKYLVMGQHGHRALVPFNMPTCFWWQSPAGERILAFRADHYHTGNFWEVHSGRVERVEDELLRYLARLEKADYSFERVAVQHSGYHTDNSPPSTASSGLVRAWNEKYAWPHLRCAVAREFPEWVEKTHATELPTFPLAWTDWWTDGFGSAARESASARLTQGRAAADESMLAMLALAGQAPAQEAAHDLADVRSDLIFWGEHTLGAAESIRQPLAEESQVQWDMKASFAWSAARREAALRESVLGRLSAAFPAADTPRLLVVNTLGFRRSGLIEINADHEVLPSDGQWRLVDDQGKALVAHRLTTRMDGSTWAIWAPEIPAFGWREFRVEPLSQGAAPAPTPPAGEMELENAWYHIRMDPGTGAIASLVDKSTGAELVDPAAEWKLGQVVHESLGNREQLEGFMLESFKRAAMTDVKVEGVTRGPIWDSLSIRGELPGCQGPGGVRCELRLFHTDKRVELHYTLQKRRVYEPEGLYVAFPFAGQDGAVEYEALGAPVSPATDILPGAATDWQTMQSYVSARWPSNGAAPARQVVLSSNEIPLIQVGGINLGKFQRRMRVDRPHIYSWVMNNYWTTNFCAAQEGEFHFSYTLTSGDRPSAAAAARSGWSERVPLAARLLPGGGPARPLASRSLLSIDAGNLMLIAARPGAEARTVLLHLREVNGHPARLDCSSWRGVRGMQETNALDQPIPQSGQVRSLDFRPHEVKFLRIDLE